MDNHGKMRSRILKIIAVMIIIAIFLAFFLQFMNRNKEYEMAEEETVQYADNIVIYRPGYSAVAYDEEDDEFYYNNLLLVFLTEEFATEEKENLAAQVNGEIVGYINGAVNLLQVKVPETDLAGLEAYGQQIMSAEHVMCVTHDAPVLLQENASADQNPWNEALWPTGEIVPEQDRGNEDCPDGNDWWAEAIGAYTAWENYAGLAGEITVGVIDSGFYTEHEEINGKITMVNDIDTPAQHGTHVAGLIAAENNEVGIRGVADQAKLLCADISDDGTSFNVSNSYIIGLLVSMLQGEDGREKVKIINMSFGIDYYYPYEQYLYEHSDGDVERLINSISKKFYSEYIDYTNSLWAQANQSARLLLYMLMNLYLSSGEDDYLLVQSAGNGVFGDEIGMTKEISGFACAVTEAAYKEALSCISPQCQSAIEDLGYSFFDERILIVGSVDNEVQDGCYVMSSFSNYGVDICAPGRNIYSLTEYENGYGELSGTSMAAPIVSGAAAFIWSLNPDLSAPEVRQILLNNYVTMAVDEDGGDDNIYPMLNVGLAAKAAYDLGNGQYNNPVESGEGAGEQINVAAEFKEYLETVLIPEYGVIDTEELHGSRLYKEGEEREWAASELTGILSADIRDYDGDGQEEMVTVAFFQQRCL